MWDKLTEKKIIKKETNKQKNPQVIDTGSLNVEIKWRDLREMSLSPLEQLILHGDIDG